MLRERLRRTQERERTVERRLKDSEDQLQRSQTSVARLKKLVEQRDLGQRDELTRKLDEEKGLRQEAERKVKVRFFLLEEFLKLYRPLNAVNVLFYI